MNVAQIIQNSPGAESGMILFGLAITAGVWAFSLWLFHEIIRSAVRKAVNDVLSNVRQFPVVLVADARQQQPQAQQPKPPVRHVIAKSH